LGQGAFSYRGLSPPLCLKDKEDVNKYKTNWSGHSAPLCRAVSSLMSINIPRDVKVQTLICRGMEGADHVNSERNSVPKRGPCDNSEMHQISFKETGTSHGTLNVVPCKD